MRPSYRPLVWETVVDNVLLYAKVDYAEDPTRQSPGRVTGVLVTYGEQAQDRPDVYESESLTWPAKGIVLNEMHDRQQPIKRFTPYLDGAQLRVDFPLPPTQRGRDAAYMVRDGTYAGLSMEVERDTMRAVYRSGVRHVTYGLLTAAALVDEAAFLGSTVEINAKRETNDVGALAWL